MTPDIHPEFPALRKTRDLLTLRCFGCDCAAYVAPHDPQVAEERDIAHAELTAWDSAHADEWNANKPWYEKRLTK